MKTGALILCGEDDVHSEAQCGSPWKSEVSVDARSAGTPVAWMSLWVLAALHGSRLEDPPDRPCVGGLILCMAKWRPAAQAS